MRWLLAGVLGLVQVLWPLPALGQSGVWFPMPGNIGDNTLVGAIDQPAAGAFINLAAGALVSGWVVDTTAQGWSGIDSVQVWSGFMDAGGSLLGQAAFQQNRPDVAAALHNPFWAPSGFSATLSSQALANVSTLYVYAHTPAKGWWYAPLEVTIAQITGSPELDIEAPTPGGTIHAAQPFTLRGYAFDRSASGSQGAGIDRVQVYLNGDRQSGVFIGDATLGLPDQAAAALGAQFLNAGWQLTFQANSWLPSISDNQITTLTVYARSGITGQESSQPVAIVLSVP